ncbi:MAG: transglycosylase SLT domain-containing protein [Alphaproteobacteria bacterium]|nr:transglycosylase SLT domain-containing protein [Alphaproteobacteria bacterium]
MEDAAEPRPTTIAPGPNPAMFFSHPIRAIVCAAVLAGALSWTDGARAEDPIIELAALNPERMAERGLPQVLDADDAQRYRHIFQLQDQGHWKRADAEIAKLGDRVLMGHVLAQRYLHPTHYRSRYKELKSWLDQYNDHHDAQQIYKLALSRRPANATYPNRPETGRGLYDASAQAAVKVVPPRKNLSTAERRRAATLKVMVRSYLRKGHTLSTKRLVESDEAKLLFSSYDMDWARAYLAKGYFMDGRDDWAVEWAEKATSRSGQYLPEAHWIAGLSHWRMGNLDKAASHFEAAAEHDADPWTHAASAFWAARSHLLMRNPERVMPLLEQAAEHPRTFYGMLASKLLGKEHRFNWTLPAIDGAEVRAVLDDEGGRRALALLQIGQHDLAEKELRQIARLSNHSLADGILAIAQHAGMAELSIRLDAMLYPNGGGYDGAAYPLPAWEPEDGFKVDRALIYALVRQESRFNPEAKSGVGARGLMQLMPATASFVAQDRSLHRSNRSDLYDPGLNLRLGQQYITMLLEDEKIQNDLFLMAAAWNGGPGNLNKWRRKVDDLDDSLFFIESLPSRETRVFIERVLTNLWIYRDRLGQRSPSLDAVASGAWPSYDAQGQTANSDGTEQVAQHVEN